jgi:hypothetical protein
VLKISGEFGVLLITLGLQPARNTNISCYDTVNPLSFLQTIKNTFNWSKDSDRVFCWLLILKEHGVIFEYLPGKNNVVAVADALSHLDIDSLKIQEEEASTLFSRSGNISMINIELPMYNALIFKEQLNGNNQGIKRKRLSTTSLLNTIY